MSIAEGKFLEEARRGAASSSEHGLQRWVQFVLADTEQTLASAHTAYTKLAQQRLDAKARGQVREVLQSARVQEALSRLAEEVGAGKLQVREDKNVATDLGLRDSILRLALSFSPVYLRPALEALFRRTIPRAHERDSVNLYRFMLAHVTKNAELAAKSLPTYPDSDHLMHSFSSRMHFSFWAIGVCGADCGCVRALAGRYGVSGQQSTLSIAKEYFSELNQVMLNNFMRLIVLLEACKQQGALDNFPPLFRRETTLYTPQGVVEAKTFKSTRDVVVAFTSDLLCKEGDVLKHLGQLGCHFKSVQSAIDEYDFAVGNVVSDLRDGVVAARLVEILFSQAAPLMERMRVPAVSRLQKVHNAGVALAELERLGVHTPGKEEAKQVVDGDRTTIVSLLWTVAHAVQWRERFQEDTIKEEIARVRAAAVASAGGRALASMRLADKPAELLLQWCSCVCETFGMQIENFSRSFAESRALCLLASYYVPELLPVDSLGEGKENFRMFAGVLDTIGGVPCMLQASDVTNTTPDQGLIMTFVTHLCFRLIDLGKDSRAVGKIQRAWRVVLAFRREAASRAAAALLQRCARGFLGRLAARRRLAACVKIQATARMTVSARRFRADYRRVLKVQAFARMLSAMSALADALAVKRALAAADSRIAARKQEILERKHRHLICACIVAQRIYRGWVAVRTFRMLRSAAIQAQRRARGFLVRRAVAKQHAAGIKIQTVFRCFSLSAKYQATRAKIVAIETWWRCYSAYQSFHRVKDASVTMQSQFRGRQDRLLCKAIRASIQIQRIYKGYRALKAFHKAKASATKIQTAFRCFIEKCKYQLTHSRMVQLQTAFRRYSQQKEYASTRAAIVLMEKMARGFLVRRAVAKQHAASVKIQTVFRRYLQVCTFSVSRARIVKIQTAFRCFSQSSSFHRLRTGSQTAQRLFRGRQARRLATMMRATVRIQTAWRGYAARAWARRYLRSVSVVQAHYRGWVERKRMWAACRQLASKAREMRQRIAAAKAQVQQHMTLGNRTQAGLDVLIHSDSISAVIKAVGSLEVATQWSDVCAQCIAELGAVEKLYSVLRSCNRSQPHIILARQTLATLNNFTRYGDRFRPQLAALPLAAQALGEVMQSMSSTDEEVVALAAALLRFLTRDADTAAAIAAVPAERSAPAPLTRFQTVLASFERKVGVRQPLAATQGAGGAKGKDDRKVATVKTLKAAIKAMH